METKKPFRTRNHDIVGKKWANNNKPSLNDNKVAPNENKLPLNENKVDPNDNKQGLNDNKCFVLESG